VWDRKCLRKLEAAVFAHKEIDSMKNIFAKILILGALLLSTTAALPMTQVPFDGGTPYPTCIPGVNCAL
jgi:hypothetical protein